MPLLSFVSRLGFQGDPNWHRLVVWTWSQGGHVLQTPLPLRGTLQRIPFWSFFLSGLWSLALASHLPAKQRRGSINDPSWQVSQAGICSSAGHVGNWGDSHANSKACSADGTNHLWGHLTQVFHLWKELIPAMPRKASSQRT